MRRFFEEQVTLTSVKEKGREIGIPKLGGRKKVKAKSLSIFTRQFSVMIDAGLPLVQCLEILAQQQENKYFQQTRLQVRQDVEEGSTLAGAMARHPKVFDNLLPTWLKPRSGRYLDLILPRLQPSLKDVKLSVMHLSMIYPLRSSNGHRGDRRDHGVVIPHSNRYFWVCLVPASTAPAPESSLDKRLPGRWGGLTILIVIIASVVGFILL